MRTIVEPGDIFIDADGLAWIGSYSTNSDESTDVILVWFTPESKGMTPGWLTQYLDETGKDHPESNPNTRIPVELLSLPFRLVAELNKKEE